MMRRRACCCRSRRPRSTAGSRRTGPNSIHVGGNSSGEFCFTLDITDIATGWTGTRSVRNQAQKWVFAYESRTPLRASHALSWESILIMPTS